MVCSRAALVRTLRVTGMVDDDDTKHRILAARVPGRVEKLFVNYVGAEVTEGAPLAVIFEIARAVEHWPAYLRHYRFVRFRELGFPEWPGK